MLTFLKIFPEMSQVINLASIKIFKSNILSLILAHYDKLILLLIPVAFAILNSHWLVNKADIDVWFYYGYMRYFLDYWGEFSPSDAHLYYGTRIPYTFPGYIAYSIFGAEFGRFVFKFLLIYPIIIICFWYVVKENFSRKKAFAISLMLATNIYFLRTIGYDYVDNGVLAYQAITFALLTTVAKRKRSRGILVLAGFSATSMVAVHLMSAVFLPVFLAYYIVAKNNYDTDYSPVRSVFDFFIYGCVGAIAGLGFFGLIFKIYTGGSFFFFLPQIQLFIKDSSENYLNQVNYLLSEGYWLTVHVAVLFSALLALFFVLVRQENIRRIEIFWLLAGVSTYLFIFVASPSGFQLYSGRDGLYASFFLLITYITTGVLLFRGRDPSTIDLILVAVSFIGGTAFRFVIGDGSEIRNWISLPMISVALLIGLAAFLSFEFGSQRPFVRFAAIFVVGFGVALVPLKFDGYASITKAHEIISNKTQGRLPKIFWSEASANKNIFMNIASSFTERAWWQRGSNFPGCSQEGGGTIEENNLVVVLSSKEINNQDLEQFKDCAGDLVDIGVENIALGGEEYGMYFFEVAPLKTQMFRYYGSTLPSRTGLVEKEARAAREGSDPEGILTFGPYRSVKPGRYAIRIVYAALGKLHRWDMLGSSSKTSKQSTEKILDGLFTDTEGKFEELVFEIDIMEPMGQLQVRTYFAGKGQLVVRSIAMEKVFNRN